MKARSVKQVEVAGKQPTISDAESLLVRGRGLRRNWARRLPAF